MVPTDCAGDGTPDSKGITPCALAAAAPPFAVGLDDDPVGGDGGAAVVQSEHQDAAALAYVAAGPSTVLGEEVSLTVTSMPVAVVIVKPDAKVVATMPVEPPSTVR